MHPASPISIQRIPARRLRVRLDRPHPARRGVIELHRLSGNGRRPQVPRVQELPQRPAVHGAHPAVEQPGPVQLAQDRRDAARPVHVLQVVGAARRDLAQARHPAGQLVDLLEPEVHPGLVRRGEQVQDRVRRPAHGHVQRHRVLERVPAGDRAGSTETSPSGSTAWLSSAIKAPARSNSPRRAECVASVLPLPGRARPIASVRQFIELAVNMPEHEPHVGQADSSMASS